MTWLDGVLQNLARIEKVEDWQKKAPDWTTWRDFTWVALKRFTARGVGIRVFEPTKFEFDTYIFHTNSLISVAALLITSCYYYTVFIVLQAYKYLNMVLQTNFETLRAIL